MHNNIMAASLRDRPPMLAIGRYAQSRSRFLRYIDTRNNGDSLRKCILEGPYTPSTVIIPAVHATENSPLIPKQTTESDSFDIGPGIGDNYLTVDYLMPDSHEVWESIERSHASTKNKGKEISKPITPPSESASEEDNDPEQAQKDKEMQKNLASLQNMDTTPRYKNDNQTGQFGNQRTMTVVGARETVGSPVVKKSGIQCFNCKEFGHFAKECRKPKRVKDPVSHEKVLLCKQAEKGVPLQAEQYDWLADTDEEIDEQ
ncbi:integrase, catalytic region, zinc finger, CCHC-type containing protein [Tanacetum coccineum]